MSMPGKQAWMKPESPESPCHGLEPWHGLSGFIQAGKNFVPIISR